jgi:hypothetical protein
MMVLGADMHKRSHAVVAVAAVTGEVAGEKTVAVGVQGLRGAVGVGWRARLGARVGA